MNIIVMIGYVITWDCWGHYSRVYFVDICQENYINFIIYYEYHWLLAAIATSTIIVKVMCFSIDIGKS